jgi:hypothetical protein
MRPLGVVVFDVLDGSTEAPSAEEDHAVEAFRLER